MRATSVRIETAVVHGHRMHYRVAGDGPQVVCLIHGITGSSQTWEDVMPLLAEEVTVVAPDLLGHGQSAKPQGDYSLGAYASGVRDLLALLGHERATVLGHSLGGGVAMQFAYQFPERVERLVLVDSGGLGRDVAPLLRAPVLPGAELVMPLLFSPPVLAGGEMVGRAMRMLGVRVGVDMEEVARGFASLGDFGNRRAFVHTVRGLLDLRGQRVSATDRLYLSAALPSLLIWGERDPILPLAHGEAAQEQMPGSRLEVFPGAGHFPHREDPERFASVLLEFLRTTEPKVLEFEDMRERLREGATT